MRAETWPIALTPLSVRPQREYLHVSGDWMSFVFWRALKSSSSTVGMVGWEYARPLYCQPR